MNTKYLLVLLLMTSHQLSIAHERLLVVTKSTHLKTQPNSVSKKMIRLAENDTLIFLGQCERHYCKVSFKNKIGWVKKYKIREVFSAGKKEVSNTNTAPQELVDSTAWDDIPIFTEPAAVVAKSPMQQDFDRLRSMRKADAQLVVLPVVAAKDKEKDSHSEILEEEEMEEGKNELIHRGVFFLILFVIFFKIVKGFPVFKKSVPDWERSIHFKTVDKSSGENVQVISSMIQIIAVAIVLIFIFKVFVVP